MPRNVEVFIWSPNDFYLVIYIVVLRPVGDRPKTSASTARRMVANALGVRVNISKEQRDKERRELQEAKEKKRKEKQARVDPWKD